MTVDTNHDDYTKNIMRWQRCRDVLDGADTILAGGVLYLPKLSGMEEADYTAYKLRAGFFAASQRTLDGLTGMVFRKKPDIDVPNEFELLAKDISSKGQTLETFAELFVDELMRVGRVGALVDFPEVAAMPQNKAQEQQMGLRPYAVIYKAESIINWKSKPINKVSKLSLVVLQEQVADDANDEFEHKTKTQWRVLDLDEVGNYRQRVYVKRDGEFFLISEAVPLVGGKPLREIPFVIASVNGESNDVEKPPLLDLCDANLEHYRLMADYRHGLHFTALPTPVISGHTLKTDDDGKVTETMSIGSTTAWCFPDPSANAFFLEFSGKGLAALESAINKQENVMALLGARIIAGDKKAAETAETANIHRAGEASVLTSIANSASRCLTKVLNIIAQWAGIKTECKVQLNTDFVHVQMTAQDLTAWVSAYMNNSISWNTFFYNLKRAELYEPTLTADDEQARLNSGDNMPTPNIKAH